PSLASLLPGRLLATARFAAQNEAGRIGLGDALPVLVGHFALDISHVLATVGYSRLGAQPRSPDRTEEVDAEIYAGEPFIRCQGRRERHSHRGVREVAEDAAMQGAHWIEVLRTGLHGADGAAIRHCFDGEADQLGDRWLGDENLRYERMSGVGRIRHVFEVAIAARS